MVKLTLDELIDEELDKEWFDLTNRNRYAARAGVAAYRRYIDPWMDELETHIDVLIKRLEKYEPR